MNRRMTRRFVKLLQAVMAALVLVGGGDLLRPLPHATALSARPIQVQASQPPAPIHLENYNVSEPAPARSMQPKPILEWNDLVQAVGASSTPASKAPEEIYLPPKAVPLQVDAAPTPSGATNPAPLNHTFDAPSYDVVSLIPNLTFEQDAYTVGTPPTNHDFETGDLTGWTSVGTVSVKSGGPTGYYAEVGSTGRITSTAFTVPNDAQTFTLSALIGNYAGFYVYVASGAGYGTITEVLYAYSPRGSWTVFRFDAAKWRGQSIKLYLRPLIGTISVDNVGVANVVVPQWDSAGVLEQMNGGPSGKYVKLETYGGQLYENRGIITSTAFTVPADGHRLKVDILGAEGSFVGQSYVYVLSGPAYATSTLLGAAGTTTWQTYSWDITKWSGRSIKIRLQRYQGSWVALDNVGIVQSILPNWEAYHTIELATGGPWGNYAKIPSPYGTITSTAFAIPAQASVMQLDILVSSQNYGARAFILSGQGYGTSTMVLDWVSPTTWQRYTFDVTQWAGQSVKIVLKAGTGISGWAAFDNVGANLVEEKCGDPCYPSIRVGAPVDTSTGAESLRATDLALPGRGIPIEFNRSYFSQSTYTGTLGFRWMHDYEMSLSIAADLTATVRYGSGSIARFVKSGSSYVSPPGNYDTLVQNGDGTYSLTTKRQIKYSFPSGGGVLQKIEDRNGNATTLSYSSGLLSNINDPANRSITITYNVDNRISQIADPLGRTVQYGYSAVGDLITVTNTAGEVSQYTYDNHRLVSATDNAGKVLFYNYYDTANRVITQTLGSAYTTTFAYNSPSAGQTTVVDPRGNSTVYFFDTRFRTSDIQDPYGNYVTYGFDANNRVVTATNQLGQSTLYSYDSKGNLTRTTDALGKTSVLTYTALNDLSAQSDPLGRTTNYGYDAHGNLTSVTDALNQVTSLGRDAYGQFTAITNTLGYTTTFDYDSYGNVTGATNALGQRQAFAYDIVSRNTSTTDPRSQTTTFQYDGVGRVLTVTNPLNQAQSFSYDSGGHGALAKWWDAKGNATEYGRNTRDWLTSVLQQIDGSGQTASYVYDANGNLTSQPFTSYSYDKASRPITVTDSPGKLWLLGYDAIGRTTSQTDPRGNTTTFGYDAVGRLLTVTFPISTVVYAYDDVGNRASMVDSTGTTTYEYDALSRPITITHPGNNVVVYHYDAVGNRDRVTLNATKVVSYTFNAANRLTEVTDWQGRTTRYGYDESSRVISSTLPNAVQISYGYDNANRLNSVSNSLGGNALSVYTYTLDSVGNRTQMQELSGTRVYTYNEAYWLKNETFPDGSVVTYTHTISTGNRSTKVDGSGTTVHTYTDDTLLAQAGSTTYNWDDNGNLTGRDADSFTYDYGNRLTQAVVGGITTTYTYNGDALRIGKSTSGGASNSMVWDVNLGLPQVISDSTYVYIYGLGPIGMVDAQGIPYYFLRDGLGSVAGIVDANGVLTATYSYDSYGNLLSSTGTLPNAFRYTGEWYDGETGFYYLRARYYDPTVGRFISKDPWPGIPTRPYSLNPYLYVENNSVNLSDPSGRIGPLLLVAALVVYSPEIIAAAVLATGAVYLALEYYRQRPAEVEAFGEYCVGSVQNLRDLVVDLAAKGGEQLKPLSPGEIKKLKKAKIDVEYLKEDKGAGKRELRKDKKGNIFVTPRGGSGPGEPTGLNIDDIPWFK